MHLMYTFAYRILFDLSFVVRSELGINEYGRLDWKAGLPGYESVHCIAKWPGGRHNIANIVPFGRRECHKGEWRIE